MTPFSALLGICGLSQDEAAAFLGVRRSSVAHWMTGRRQCPPGAVREIHALAAAQMAAAQRQARAITDIIAAAPPGLEGIEIGAPVDDTEAQALGLPTVSAWTATLGMALALLPMDIVARISLVPRGTTSATAAAADTHAL